MEIGEHGAGGPEFEARIDVQIGVALGRRQPLALHGGLQRADSRRPDGHQAGGGSHLPRLLLRDLKPLRVETVVLDDFGVDWLEGAETHVQRDTGDLDARGPAFRENLGVKCSPAVGAATEPLSRA